MDFAGLRRHPHLLGAAPGDRPDIALVDVVGGDHLLGRLGQIVQAGRDLEAEDPGGIDQPRIVIVEAEHLAVVDALAFEHATRIMQPVGQHMQLGIAPGDEAAVIPDEAVAIVEGKPGSRHWLFLALGMWFRWSSVAEHRAVVAATLISQKTPDCIEGCEVSQHG